MMCAKMVIKIKHARKAINPRWFSFCVPTSNLKNIGSLFTEINIG